MDAPWASTNHPPGLPHLHGKRRLVENGVEKQMSFYLVFAKMFETGKCASSLASFIHFIGFFTVKEDNECWAWKKITWIINHFSVLWFGERSAIVWFRGVGVRLHWIYLFSLVLAVSRRFTFERSVCKFQKKQKLAYHPHWQGIILLSEKGWIIVVVNEWGGKVDVFERSSWGSVVEIESSFREHSWAVGSISSVKAIDEIQIQCHYHERPVWSIFHRAQMTTTSDLIG